MARTRSTWLLSVKLLGGYPPSINQTYKIMDNITHVRNGRHYVYMAQHWEYFGIERRIRFFRLYSDYVDALKAINYWEKDLLQENYEKTGEWTISGGRSTPRMFTLEYKLHQNGLYERHELTLNEVSID